MNKENFYKKIKNINIDLTEEQIEKLDSFCSLLLEYNKTTNLTAIRTVEGVYLKHFYDSLTIVNLIENNSSILDIGCGAGFPGLVLSIARPDLKVFLLDSNNKKVKFLEYIVKELNLDNVTIIYDRAEKYAKNNLERFDYVTSRAVADLRILIELAIPVLKVYGKFIAMKGNAEEELNNSKETLEFFNSSIESENTFKLPIENSNRNNIVIIKKEKCSKEFPRDYDKIIKKPLKKINK